MVSGEWEASSPPIAIGVKKRRPSRHRPRFSERLIMFRLFENDEQRYKEDVVVIKFSKDIQHRLLSFGEVTKQSEG